MEPLPTVDGLDATRAIRLKVGRARPLIATTANVFVEDRARCLAAGMNDHVAKAVASAMLPARLLRWWLPLSNHEPEVQAMEQLPGSVSPSQLPFVDRLRHIDGFDAGFALRQVGGQSELLSRVLSRFVALYRSGLPEFLDRSGSEEQIRARWMSVCHSLRGAVAVVGAVSLTEEATEMERQLRDKAVALATLSAAGIHLNAALIGLAESLAKELW